MAMMSMVYSQRTSRMMTRMARMGRFGLSAISRHLASAGRPNKRELGSGGFGSLPGSPSGPRRPLTAAGPRAISPPLAARPHAGRRSR